MLTPPPNSDEDITLTVTATATEFSNGSQASDARALNITVNPAGDNTPPIAVPDTNAGDPVIEFGFAPGMPFGGDPSASGDVLANDVDPDPNPGLHVTAVNGSTGDVGNVVTGTYGTVQIQGNGAWTYNLNDFDDDTNSLAQGETAYDEFTYTVTDAQGASSTTTLTVAINGTNDFPVIAAERGYRGRYEGRPSTASGQIVATDPDHGATLHYQLPYDPATTTFAADYHFDIDQFTITRFRPGIDTAPIQVLNDTFSDNAPPPSSPPYSNGVAAGYVTRGFFTEADGRAVMDGALAQTVFGGPGVLAVGHSAIALTSTSSDLTTGLRAGHNFDVMGRFDALLPTLAGSGYGISLTDATPTSGGDDNIQLLVQRDAGGAVHVVLREADVVGLAITPIDSEELGPVADGDQIMLHLAHDWHQPGSIVGSFEVLHGTEIVQSHTFDAMGQIYGTETPGFPGDDENVTRGTFFTVSTPTVSTRTGIYGALTLDSATGEWHYTLNNSDPDTQALGQGITAIDSFDALAIDQFSTAAVDNIRVTVHGTNDAPVAVNDSASTSEDAATSIAVLANDHDVDTGDTLHVAGLGSATGSGLSTLGAKLTVNPDGTVQYDPRTAALLQALNEGETLTDTFTYSALDQHDAASPATVSVVVQGAAEPPPADGEVFEDGSRHASGQLALDDGATATSVTGSGPNTLVADYRFLVDALTIRNGSATFFVDEFTNGNPPPAWPTVGLGQTPPVGTPNPGYFTSRHVQRVQRAGHHG